MATLHVFICVALFCLIPVSFSDPIPTQFYPNSTFNAISFTKNYGYFLSSPNSNFSAAFYNPGGQQSRFYLVVIHTPSNSLVWSANSNAPVPSTAVLSLSSSSLSVSFPNGSIAWSTPPLSSPIQSLQLLNSGNLVLLDLSNSSLWQSFEHPTDTLLPGQRLASSSALTSMVSDSDLSGEGYRLFVTSNDAVMRWGESQQYWGLSADDRSFKGYSTEVAYMAINGTGMYLFDADNRVVFRVVLRKSDGFRIGKMDSNGQFRIVTYESGNVNDDFVALNDACSLPLACNTLGLCPAGLNVSTCSCPESFGQAKGRGCLPTDGSVLASPSSCSGASAVSYLTLGAGISYFANKFANPTDDSGFSSCQDACSRNCSCLGFFYRNSSMACYLVQNQLGSLIKGSSTPMIGYIKTLKSSSSSSPSSPNSKNKSSTNIVPILLPLIATALLVLVLSFVGFRWWRKRTNNKGLILDFNMRENRPVHPEAHLEVEVSDDDEILIPGLPTRFTYADLTLATNNFQTLIGSGGFGTVYKGELPDETLIAVKRITNTGIQGKREFCTEIAVIGSIHHVNLVNLLGYCCEGSNRLLVYEYMNRGSLDKPLFGSGLVLEWQERMEIATGAARGLAYLHSGCDHRILHFDIKPENILLSDQGQVKIGDFGIAKLMSREQSRTFTRLRGTRGYIAPEWLTNSALSDKTDVYSFGMVLLEIVGGRKNSFTGSVDPTGSSGEYFPLVALEKHMEGRWMELVDPRMKGWATQSEVVRVVKVALCCVHEKSSMRPSMGTVVGMLEGTVTVWEPGVEVLWYLRRYRRGGGGNTESAEAVGNSTSTSLQTNISSDELSGPR